MKGSIILLIILFCSVSTRAQNLPWFFNTHTFRNWVMDQKIENLVFKMYEPIKIERGVGYSHNTYFCCPEGSQYIFIKGYFRKYTLDSLGFILKQENYMIQINFEEMDSSEVALNYFKELMEKMASEGYKPEKKNIEKRNPQLGSTLYIFNPFYPKPGTNGYGEGIIDDEEIIYRETGSNFHIAELNTNYNYDIVLSQLISYTENVPEKIVNYVYQGDFYDPLKYIWSYAEKLDTMFNLTFDGVYADPETYSSAGQVVDTIFELPHYKRVSYKELMEDLKFDEFITSVTSNEIQDGFTIKRIELGDLTSKSPSIINEIIRPKTNAAKTSTYHMICLAEKHRYSSGSYGFPFKLDYWGNYFKGFRLTEIKEYGQKLDTIILKTDQQLYRNGRLQKLTHSIYARDLKDWVIVSIEEYSKSGHLQALKISNNNLNANYLSYFGERADLGFLEQSEYLNNCKVSNDGNILRIMSEYGEPIIIIEEDELKISVKERSGDCTFEKYDPDYNYANYCLSTYSIKRKGK